MMDLLAESTEMDIGAITRLQRLKTGEMFAFSAVSGAILGKGPYRAYMALHNYAQEFGLAFQIVDDLLTRPATPNGSASRPAAMPKPARRPSCRFSAPSGRGRRPVF